MPALLLCLSLLLSSLVLASPYNNGQIRLWSSIVPSTCINTQSYYGTYSCFTTCNQVGQIPPRDSHNSVQFFSVVGSVSATTMTSLNSYMCNCPKFLGAVSNNDFISTSVSSMTVELYPSMLSTGQQGLQLIIATSNGASCTLDFYISSGEVLGVTYNSGYVVYWYYWGWAIILVCACGFCLCIYLCIGGAVGLSSNKSTGGVVRGPPQAPVIMQHQQPPIIVQAVPVNAPIAQVVRGTEVTQV